MDHAIAVAEHPSDLDVSKFGMWLFLASEIMFFAGFIGAYIVLRTSDTTGIFAEGQHHLNKMLAAVNTAVLIFSSFTMAMAVHASKKGDTPKIRMYLVLTLLCGLGFMVIKFVEYKAKFAVGHGPGFNLFYATYFTMTGFHGLHVLAGMIALGIVCAVSHKFTPVYNTPVEVTGLYWHLVDLVWIFLFPIVYLI
ncbi:MAG: cytochrome c oxidase subunit 3 family protein [Planctomycetes bacterium]|nr:cytochrome c oxidase subunit 3 family protein [Planctomycetota bacterium]